LFFQSWMKYRWHLRIAEEEDEGCLERLSCLLGLGLEEFRHAVPRSRRLLRYIGLFTQFPRSALSLRALLSDALDLPHVDVVPCILQMMRIPDEQRCLLGVQGTTQGDDCYLGQEIEDRMGKFRISAGPLGEDKFHSLLPPTPQFREVGDLVHVFLIDPLEYEMELVLKREEAQTMVLGGEKWSGLGYDTWIFSGPRLETEARVTFQLVREIGAHA
ncbi:MAG: type VI secretion system baseplate subunit TssG, partial [Proteobacteria bacterium]|nr:type VI secretion system baseplate subunit TssG [Pseudomonadota bacterium]